ncbi:hypothetical protein TNCV_4232761 [Trichonephila clavipes]|nr:hypothetical protein TNCV_4232761 [Trichonephila clavipes]
MHLSSSKRHSQLCRHLRWDTLRIAQNADMHYMYGLANGNGRVVLRMYHAQFPNRRKPDHSIFQRLHRQLHETRSFYVTRYDEKSCTQPKPGKKYLERGDRPESGTRAVAHHV